MGAAVAGEGGEADGAWGDEEMDESTEEDSGMVADEAGAEEVTAEEASAEEAAVEAAERESAAADAATLHAAAAGTQSAL
jgi:hypothetical protein